MSRRDQVIAADGTPEAHTDSTLITIIDRDEVVRLGVVAALHATEGFRVATVHADATDVTPRRGLILLGARAMAAHEATPVIRRLPPAEHE